MRSSSGFIVAQSPEPGTQNVKPGTWNPEPGTRNPEPGTWNLEPGTVMTPSDRQEFRKVLEAHAQTVAICEACAMTTRDLAAEVARGGVPALADLKTTISEAERTLVDLARVREEIERLMAAIGLR
jgi:hypothetical protein